jgi:DNA-binding MarR family transcriptional regulator
LDQAQDLGHARGLCARLGLVGELDKGADPGTVPVGVAEYAVGPDPAADRDRGAEPDAVKAVVQAHHLGSEVEEFGDERGCERKDQIAVRDGGAERALSAGAFDVEVDLFVHAIEDALTEFFDAYRRSRARLHRDPGLRQLSMAQFAVLQAVAAVGRHGVTRIATQARMAQPPASRALDRLERKGLLRRESAADKRVKAVTVTAAGQWRVIEGRRAVGRQKSCEW